MLATGHEIITAGLYTISVSSLILMSPDACVRTWRALVASLRRMHQMPPWLRQCFTTTFIIIIIIVIIFVIITIIIITIITVILLLLLLLACRSTAMVSP